MKVCLISGEFRPMQGGVGDFTYEVGRALRDLGATVTVLTSTAAGPARNEGGLRVEPRLARWGWHSWRTILRTAEELEADVLNIQYQAAAYGMHPAINLLPLRLRARKRRPGVVVTFHDLKVPYLFPKAGRVRWWVVLALARWSDAVIVTNEEDLETLLQSPPSSAPYLIPIGSNIEPAPPADYDRDAWRARWGVRPEDILLSYFGFLNESKGGEILVRALGEVVKPALSRSPERSEGSVEGMAEGQGSRARLLMVGGKWGSSDPTNLAYAQRVETLIDELGLSERVMWTGYTPQEEVSANLLASDICVLPYRDGASFRRGSFMAALVHGLPIVTTNPKSQIPNPKSPPSVLHSPSTPGLPRLRDGENVLLVPPGDAVALAEAIARLAENPELRQRIGQGAKETSKAFGWDSIAEKTLEIYHAIRPCS
jgi:glycosyltransferase involved in cell wall biosynthesis